VRRAPRICLAVVDHAADAYLDDLLASLRRFCPEADVIWYDTGATSRGLPDVPRLSRSRVHLYAKITPVFFDLFEWWIDQDHDYLINLETDLAVVNPGVGLIGDLMGDADYMAARLVLEVPTSSRWRPYYSLRKELPELRDILERQAMRGAFSPAQVFSKPYVERILDSSFYPRLRDFVARNQAPDRSFTLQEVLLPTLADVVRVRSRAYPGEHQRYNRYRPYHALPSVSAARAASVPFVHPIRRATHDDARRYVRELAESEPPLPATLPPQRGRTKSRYGE